MPPSVESGAYRFHDERSIPWHSLGEKLDPEKEYSTQEILVAAGLDWQVNQYEVWACVEGIWIQVKEAWANVRSDKLGLEEGILGIVGDRYQVYQNDALVEFGNVLVNEVGGTWDTAWSLDHGRTVCACFKLPTDVVVGERDLVQGYLTVANNHTADARMEAFVSEIRTVCMNTLNLGRAMAQAMYRIKHTESMKGRVAEAQKALALSTKAAQEFSKLAEQMLATELEDQAMRAVLEEVFPMPEKPEVGATSREQKAWTRKCENVDMTWDQIMFLFTFAETQAECRNTVWGGYNAVTEWAQWEAPLVQRQGQSDMERRYRSIRSGKALEIEQAAMDKFLALV